MTSRLVRGFPRQLTLMKLKRRCSILFHLLVPGGKWRTWMARPVLLGESLQLCFPEAEAIAVTAAAVGCDREGGGVGVALLAEVFPPAQDRVDRELGGVVVDPDVDPAPVVGEVVDPVGD